MKKLTFLFVLGISILLTSCLKDNKEEENCYVFYLEYIAVSEADGEEINREEKFPTWVQCGLTEEGAAEFAELLNVTDVKEADGVTITTTQTLLRYEIGKYPGS